MEENALPALDDRAEMNPLPGLLICSYRPSDELYRLIQAFLSEPYPSILLVDDGSGPEYRPLFERIAALDRRIHLLTLECNQGKGAALKHGFRHALKGTGDSTHLLCADSDGQHLPKDVRAVAEICRHSPGQVVLGARRFTRRTPLRNLVGNRLIRILLNFVCRTTLRDTQTGLRAIPAERLRDLAAIPSNRFDYEMRQLLALIRARVPIREVPVEAVYSADYQTHFRPFRDSLAIVRALGLGQEFDQGLAMSQPLRVTLIQCCDRKYSDTQMFGVHFMPVWAYTLAAHMESVPGVQVRLFDHRIEKSEETLEESEFFLFTGINQDKEAILGLRDRIKERFPRSIIAIGGPITWSLKTAGRLSELEVFDHIFIGDGEETIVSFLRSFGHANCQKVVTTQRRFNFGDALPMHRGLLDRTFEHYYGGVIEVSRGCPFLCEFCDIRVLPDNNRSHVKKPELIVEEIDHLTALGVRQFLFACDNFIGNPAWAEEVCDAIIAWQAKSGRGVSIYTWLTINVSRHPRLLKKLREAGFDMVFIGIESFNRSSLLETAKLQNTTLELSDAIQAIQSYGFIVVGGLIFGFDTDPDNIVEITLNGILRSGMISGDPSLLTALPGTPLYRRMQLSERLRDGKLGLGGFKYQTNIRYLRPVGRIRQDFKDFVRSFNRGRYQYRRLMNFYSCIESPQYIRPLTHGYGDLGKLLRMCFRERRSVQLLAKRLGRLLLGPDRALFICLAFLNTAFRTSQKKPHWPYFKFWLFNWSNSVLKYSGLSDRDFDVDWVGKNFDPRRILPEGYDNEDSSLTSSTKSRNQTKATSAALKEFLDSRG